MARAALLLLVLLATGCLQPRPQTFPRSNAAEPVEKAALVAPAIAEALPLDDSLARRQQALSSLRPGLTGAERWDGLRQELLELVNASRRAVGLRELAKDPEASAFAQAEAHRLVEERLFDHRAVDGSQPYERWARRGGTAHVRENLYRLKASDRRAYMLFDPAQAHERLMDSAGHRGNILDPAHTGIGIGLAFDPARNSVYVVQEFVNRYLVLEPGSSRWLPGETRELRGRLLEGVPRLEPRMAILYREPHPPGDAARREESRRSSSHGASGDPVLVLSSRAFLFDPASGELALRASLPSSMPAGTYALVLYLASPEQARAGRARRSTAQGIPAATLVYEVER